MTDRSDHLDTLLARDRDELDAPAEAMDALWAAVAADTVDRAPSRRDSLQRLPTGLRIAGALVGAIAIAAVSGIGQGVRPGAAELSVELGTAAFGALIVAAVSVVVALWPMHGRPLGRLAPAWGVVAVSAPMALALWPWAGIPAPSLAAHALCAGFSTVTSVLVAASIVAFDRGDRLSTWRLLTAAGVGGLAGFLAQQLHCPVNAVPHLVLAHGVSGLAAFLLGLALSAVARRRA